MKVTKEMRQMRAEGKSYDEIAQAIGAKRTTVYDAMTGRSRVGEPRKKVAVQSEGKQVGRTLTEFRSEYDKDYIVPKKIKAAIKQVGAGWAYESEFAKLAQVSLADLANYRDMFAEHVVTLREKGRRAWAGSVATAKAMREMI